MKLLPVQREVTETGRNSGRRQLSQQRDLGPRLAFHPIGAPVLFPVACHQSATMFPKLASGIWLLSGKVVVVLRVEGVKL